MLRVPAHDIDPIFPARWSPRAMSGEPISAADLQRLFEAARWAPSSANRQPWRFVFARGGTDAFARFLDLLVPKNREWCARAGALVVACSKTTTDDGNPARTCSFDTGAAWMSLALQGSRMGLVVHGMQGFDYDRAASELGVPQDHAVEMMIAIGHPGRVEDLPDWQQAREKPSDRKPIEAFAFEGAFPAT